MSGTLRPPSLTGKKESEYIIHGYNMYTPAELLFNESTGGTVQPPFKGTAVDTSSRAFGYWYNAQDYLDIEFKSDVTIWTIGFEQASYGVPLAVYDNSGGVKKGKVTNTNVIPTLNSVIAPTWEKLVELKAGRYIISLDVVSGNGHADREWFLEAGVANKTLILHEGEYMKWNKASDLAYSDNVIPAMTSNTSPSGVASASSITNTTYDAWKAFDRVNTIENSSWYSGSGQQQWLAYEFPTSKKILKYAIFPYFASVRGYDPKVWNFEAFNGTSWIILHSVSNHYFTQSVPSYFEINDYDGTFTQYRLNILDTNGQNQCGISGFEMYELAHPSIVAHWSEHQLSEIETDGMDELTPLLDRKVTTLEPMQMQSKSDILPVGSEGKVFSRIVDLNKYFDIRSMKVEVK